MVLLIRPVSRSQSCGILPLTGKLWLIQRQSPLDEAQTLPPRVHAVLLGRLLQLSASSHEFVELAATIGREFTLDLLMTASNADTDSTILALDELWQKRIVREQL